MTSINLMNLLAISKAKLKGEKDAKRSTLDDRHYYIFELVAYRLSLDKVEVEEAILEGTQLDQIESFFIENGRNHLLFHYDDSNETPALPTTSQDPHKTKPMRSKLQIIENHNVTLTGVCLYFIRNKTILIETSNIAQEVCFGSYNFQDDSVLEAVSKQFSSLFVPVLSRMRDHNWGKITADGQKMTRDGELIKMDFLGKLTSFIAILNAAQESINEKVILRPCDKYDLSAVTSPSEYHTALSSPDTMSAIEETFRDWMKQIELVIAESEQIRREADNIGPRAELDYWKKRTSKFNYLLDQFKEQRVKSALGILQMSKSKLIHKWKKLDGKITEYGNEARDNVKYLYTLEKFCDPLYNSDPVSMIADIPGLINAVRMIHSISRYYNTSERISSLFLKITNQMINTCRAYISINGTQTVWSQAQTKLIKKIQDCIKLNQEYQNCFQKTKERVAQMPSEKPFDFSEMYIFGKFDTFIRRCQKIVDVFEDITTYSKLAESKIEGMDIFANKFTSIVANLKKRSYDFLEIRTEFDQDYADFKDGIQELHLNISEFIDSQFKRIVNTQRALQTIRRFEKLGLPDLNIQDKYVLILNHYAKDIDTVSKIYTKSRQNPSIARDLPPITGKILWARQLYRRIEQPMNIFIGNKTILQLPEAKRIIKNYNQMSAVLIEYELLYHRAWIRQVSLVISGINSTLLVKHPETNEFLINFDPEIAILIRETECMKRIDLEISPEAEELVQRQDLYKQNYNRVKIMLEEYKRVRSSIPASYEQLIANRIQTLEQSVIPGCTNITWVSPILQINEYYENVFRNIDSFDLLLKRANDITKYRIEALFNEIANTKLCELNEEEAMFVDEFVKNTENLCEKGIESIKAKSKNIEEAVVELIELLYPDYGKWDNFDLLVDEKENTTDENETEMMKQQFKRPKLTQEQIALKKKREAFIAMQETADELFNHFNHKNLEAIIKLMKNILEKIRRRILSASKSLNVYGSLEEKEETIKRELSLFKTYAILATPNLIIQPSIDEMQVNLNKSTQTIIHVAKYITNWSGSKKQIRKKDVVKTNDILLVTTDQTQDDDNDKTKSEDIGDEHINNLSANESQFTNNDVNSTQTKGPGNENTPVPVETNEARPQSSVSIIVQINYFKQINENKDIVKLLSMLSSCLLTSKGEINTEIDKLKRYEFIWQKDRDEDLKEFLLLNPQVTEFEAKVRYLTAINSEMNDYPEYLNVGIASILLEKLKIGFEAEIKVWKSYYGNACNQLYKTAINEILGFIEDAVKRLQRDIKDLDDIRSAMAVLKEVRDNEIRIDMAIVPIEESYAMIQKHHIDVPKEEIEKCDTLRYNWQKLKYLTSQKSTYLLEIQALHKEELKGNMKEFVKKCENYYDDYRKNGPGVNGITPREASDRLFIFQNKFDALFRKYTTYNAGEELFGLQITDFPELLKINKELAMLQKLYSLYNSVVETVNGYYEILWSEVNVEKIILQLGDFQNKCRRLPKALKDWQAYDDLKRQIDGFNDLCPMLELMTNKALKKRHWDRISEILDYPIDIESEDLRLKCIMEAPLIKFKEEIEEVCVSAVKERDIESKLKQVTQDWANQSFQFAPFKARGELLLKGDRVLEILALLEESLMILSSLITNRYNVPFKKQIQSLVKSLSDTNEILENWMQVQNLWIYLEAVFVGGDIAKQLPAEAKRFNGIDKSWQKIMIKAHENPNCIQCCTADESLNQLLPFLLEQLELCQKSLTGYLEKKRLIFPRFFFVSDPALLEILGQASDCHTIQSHLLSIFDNIKSVRFHDKEYDRILAVISSEGEQIELEKPLKAEGNVESWLTHLLQASQRSLHGVIRTAFMTFSDTQNFNLLDFLFTYPAQIALLSIQMIWTRDANEALKASRFDKKIMQQTNQSFLDLLNILIQQTTKDLNKNERTKFETLITIHVHQRDIFEELFKSHIKSPSDFEWLKQTRFYFFEEQDKMMISITDVDFPYQNEFLGCTERLVITPLTDRCYITLAQAIHMSMGGAPTGPAGTGKTETTKDMGRCLGKYVVTFNCSDQMDFRGLGRIFKGLAQSGTWGCFDEFNRIDVAVLSVAAQQVGIVLQCRKERKKQFTFTDGDTVDMNIEFGIFLTMNPGYAGRQELPENLKINFRTVAMMVPDRMPIIRVKMASVGFLENMVLARKFYTLYKLCEEQLSKQVHYDFGLRNILSVLRTLGSTKRASPMDSEQTIVMRVLRDMNLSKLIDEDEPLFNSLIDDLFPGIYLEKSGYPALEDAIANQVKSSGLINHPSWTLKLIQLYETQQVRHGMMTLGPSGAGKTCCIQTLMKSMTDIGEPHKEMRMNPKAITAPQMFGKLDAATNDWTDGIFSTLWRRTLKTKKGDHVWVVLDGPVDAIWIENLNSVLDDNKVLTLANGDRIPMSPNCKVIFEPHNIDNATPATVSRNGMVYMSSSGLDWNPIVKGWLKRERSTQEAEVLLNLFQASFSHIYGFFSTSLASKMDVLECMIVNQTCNLLSGLLPHRDIKEPINKHYLEKIYVFVIMWSVGAFLELEDRLKLQQYFETCTKFNLDLPSLEPNSDETIFDFYVNEKGEWRHWINKVEEYEYPTDCTPEYGTILVPNVDNVRTEFLIETISKQNKAVLLIGEQGTAKTVIIKSYMDKFNAEERIQKSLNFSSATTPNMFQRIIESYVDKRVGTTYGPPQGKKMSVFIDDVNMPVINEWGDQITNEIVRQLMESTGFYNLDKPGEFTMIMDISFLAAMIQPGGGRNDIPQRLKRHFSIFNCTLPTNSSIDKIFSVIAVGHYCSERDFPDSITNLVRKLVPITRKLWQLTKIKMLPTPAKFHYIFNLRDLSRIWQGMINTIAQSVNTEKIVVGLWKHECTRVIADRFATSEDFQWFEKTSKRVLEEELGEKYFEIIDNNRYFVDFMRDADLRKKKKENTEETQVAEDMEEVDLEIPKIYEPVESLAVLEKRLKMYLGQYNETVRGAGMDLVFFRDAMMHLIKISRIIRTPRGNALLVGVGGSGKQSLTKLASFIAGYKIFQISMTSEQLKFTTYTASNLVEDLKMLYRTAGQEGKGITFIFTDQDIKEEGFLEYINNVLSSGVVAGLFARDETEDICNDLVPIMKKEFPKKNPTSENLYEFFLSRSRQNLHLVLCFSPIGEKFRNRALKFPGLISGCTIDWFQRWPKEALIAVADHFLSNFEIVCTPEIKKELVQSMGTLHDNVADTCQNYFAKYRRSTHVTPKSYLSFINGYKTIYSQKLEEIDNLANRMDSGLDKLVEAGESVTSLKKELALKEAELIVANEKADYVLKEVAKKKEDAERIKIQVQKVKDKCQMIVNEIETDKAKAEEKLEAAKPALLAAEEALKTIKSADIATVRRLGRPPHLIQRIMDCVLLLFKIKMDPVSLDPDHPCLKPSWSESLKMMSGSNFLGNLLDFKKDFITSETIELMEPYLAMEDYDFSSALRVCGNVAGLLSWTIAMTKFYEINREVLPLKDNLVVQECRLNAAMLDLNRAQQQLDDKERELKDALEEYNHAMSEKQRLLNDATNCRKKMETASNMINGLSDEKERWTEQSKEFRQQIGRLVGDVLICTGFLSYQGPFNQDFRTLLNKEWQKLLKERDIPYSPSINVVEYLSDSTTIGEWAAQGLPSDELSIQNAIIVTMASRYSLLIDPQGQGKAWVKNKDINCDLQISTLNHKMLRQHLEDCLSLGRPLLIEDVGEDLDPMLDNVLEKNFIKTSKGYKVKVGDKEVDVAKGFQLYITTKLGNPVYSPETSAKTSIIDFTVTLKGLEDQLLGRVINTEKRELENERVKLLEDVQTNKKKMKELEDNLLYRLTTTKGSLVDDLDLINVLNITKATSIDVRSKLQIAAETSDKINYAREEYRPVATRGSILYFLIVEMIMVNFMYQTSLKQFLNLFDSSMDRSQKSPIQSKRIVSIIEYMTYEVYRYSVRGFYEEHKFMFTLLLALKIDMQSGKIRHEEFQTLIKGGASLDLNVVQQKPCKWITDSTWLNLVELSKLYQFSPILDQITRNEKAWKFWFDKDSPEEDVIPDGYSNNLDIFRKLLLIRSWCPDRTVLMAKKYISNSIGEKYVEGIVLDLEMMLEESTCFIPLVCFLHMGSDPTSLIEQLAKKKNIELKSISMGQGQEIHARRLVQNAKTNGGWVLTQNCHLSIDFCSEILDSMTASTEMNDRFRLWITTESSPKFPISLLQISIKYTAEPPQGIKAGLKRTFQGLVPEIVDISNLPQWKPMLYATAFLHTILQERRKYGPLGWNIPYEFNTSDFNATIQFLQNHLDELDIKRGISWATVRYMIGECQYGGRVTDDFDKCLLNTFTYKWFGEQMFSNLFCFTEKIFVIPKYTKMEELLNLINLVPTNDKPEAFGLHSNAAISYQTNAAKTILELIMNIQPKESSGTSGETRESLVTRIAQDMLDKLPPDYASHEVRNRLLKHESIPPLNIFLRQEIDRIQKVITIVRRTLVDLKLAIDGTIIMNENLRNALDFIYDAKIPFVWEKISWESSTLGFWFTELIERNNQFRKWCFEEKPLCFWMTGFFNAQGFLTAMRQEVTRSNKDKGWALDNVILTNDVTAKMKDEITVPPPIGVYIYGLFLEGASWSKTHGRLAESKPKILFDPMPVMHISAISNNESQNQNSNLVSKTMNYICPVYKKPKRTDRYFITTVNLRTNISPDTWTLRGACLLCDTK